MDLRQLREVVGVTSDDVDVKGYADLISDSKLRGDDPDAVGRCNHVIRDTARNAY